MVALRQRHRWTPEEYLALERMSDIRHEYFDGEIYDMAGGSEDHGTVTVNVSTILSNQLRKRDCKVFSENIRVRTDDSGLYTYPDVLVVCGEREFDGTADAATLLNPTVIIEVLSPSTENFDRGEKFIRYRQIDSLQEYVLITADMPRIELATRQPDGRWLIGDVRGLDGEVEPASIQCRLALADVYEKVTWV